MTIDRKAANPQFEFADLRSDTVTRPTEAMYEAMLRAPLGDDVLGDDPTVERLEALSIELLGKEAAVFMPSGTMANQIAIACHCERGDAILVEEEAHVLYYECGGPGAIANAVTWTLPSKLGIMDPAVVEAHVLKRSLHSPGTVLLCVENTHNRAGGTVVPLDTMAAYRAIVDRHGMKLHLDGARVFNAAIALGVPVSEAVRHADSISFCLSKGLGSPIGSLLVGPAGFIENARQWRKRLGGGMRQAGILAACGIVGLTQMVDRLAEDHRRARTMASALEEMPGLSIDWNRIQTNMVLAYVDDPEAWIEDLSHEKVLALSPGPDRLRLVFHADIDDAKLEQAVASFRKVAEQRCGSLKA